MLPEVFCCEGHNLVVCRLSAAWYRAKLANGAGVHLGDITVKLTCCVCCLQGEVAASPGLYAEQPVRPAATKGKPKKGRAAPKGGGKAAGKRKRGEAAAAAAKPEPEAAQALVSSEPASGADAATGEADAAGRLPAAESPLGQPGLAGSTGPTPDGGNAAEATGAEVSAGELQPETLSAPEAAAGPSGRKGRAGPGKAAASRSKQAVARGRKPSAAPASAIAEAASAQPEHGPDCEQAAQAAAVREVTDADRPAGAHVPAALPGARRSGRRRAPVPAPEEPAEQETPDGTRRSSRRGGPAAAAGLASGIRSRVAAAAGLEENSAEEGAAGGPSGLPTDPEVGMVVAHCWHVPASNSMTASDKCVTCLRWAWLMSASLPNSSVPPSASGHIVLAAAMLCHLLLQALSPAQKQAATVATQTSPHLLHSALLPSASGRVSAADAHSKPRPKRARAAREVQALQVSFHFVMHAPRTQYFPRGGGGGGCVLQAAADLWLTGKSRSRVPSASAAVVFHDCHASHALQQMPDAEEDADLCACGPDRYA